MNKSRGAEIGEMVSQNIVKKKGKGTFFNPLFKPISRCRSAFLLSWLSIKYNTDS